jgi:hypothetical protein
MAVTVGAVAENYAISNYHILGKKIDRKAPFSAFKAAYARISHDKIPAACNL